MNEAMQDNPPEVTDSRGATVAIDCVVAYNRSGDVVMGEVVSTGMRYVHIEARDQQPRHPDFRAVSKVRHRRGRAPSILVLQDPDGDLRCGLGGARESYLLKLP